MIRTVNNLSGEIKSLSAKLSSSQPKPTHVDTYEQETREVDNSEMEFSITPQDEEKSKSKSEYSKIENLALHKNIAHLEDHICPKCNFTFSTRENLEIHSNNFHPDVEISDADLNNIEEPRDKSDNSITSEAEVMDDIKTCICT